MAAITVLNRTLREHRPGQNGYRELIGHGAFSGTDATGTLKVTPLTRIEGVEITWLGAPASDEIPYVAGTDTDGQINADANGDITIGRTGASPTAGKEFFFRIRGR